MQRSEPLRTRIKFCGITRPEDALFAEQLGVDAIGLVFHPKSPRFVSMTQALNIASVLHPFTHLVGVFKDAPFASVLQMVNQVPLDLLQFHGEESAQFCTGFGKKYIKACPITLGMNQSQLIERLDQTQKMHPLAAGILLDTMVDGLVGGTGKSFDVSGVPKYTKKPLILAGGLTPTSVSAAILAARPSAVDVCSGIEISPGIKDPKLMEAFVGSVLCVRE